MDFSHMVGEESYGVSNETEPMPVADRSFLEDPAAEAIAKFRKQVCSINNKKKLAARI